MLPRLEVFAAIALFFFATLGSAASPGREHTIIILGTSYFPQETVVATGDSIRFVNASGADHIVVDDRETWTTGVLPNNGEVVLSVDDDLVGPFHAGGTQDVRGVIRLVAP